MKNTPLITILIVILTSVIFVAHARAHPAWGIAVDGNDQVYFSDLETVWKIDAAGKLTAFREGVTGRHVHDINVDESGNLYGVDNTYEASTKRTICALWKMTPSGEFSYILAPTHILPKAMTIWKDRAGNRYYVGQRDNSGGEIFVLKRTPEGKVKTIAGNRKAGDEYRQSILYSVGGMAFGTNETLYFTDNANVYKVSATEKLTLVAGDLPIKGPATSMIPDSKSARLLAITVDTQGAAFVADNGNRRVIKIDAKGAISTVMRLEQPWSPTGVAWRNNDLYVLESGFTPPTSYATRVQRLAADGTLSVLATVGENPTIRASNDTPGAKTESVANANFGMSYFVVAIGLGILGVTGMTWWILRKS
jgi:sugar lactone lactonase YvrE